MTIAAGTKLASNEIIRAIGTGENAG